MAAGRNQTYLPLVEQRRRGELMLWIEDLPGNVDAVGTLNKQRDQPRAQTRFWPRKTRGIEEPEDLEAFEHMAAENTRLGGRAMRLVGEVNLPHRQRQICRGDPISSSRRLTPALYRPTVHDSSPRRRY